MRKTICITCLCTAISGNCAAQSSVTIYGKIDAGISWVSNEHGSSAVKFVDGIYTPSIWGLLGTEDLGGGNSAFFRLEDQFQIGAGNILPGEGLFGRQAYVGLSNDRFGTLTLGNQFDFMFDSLSRDHDDAAFLAGGLYAFRAGPFTGLSIPDNPTGGFDWDRMAAEQVHNSVKYASPEMDGFKFGAMYGFGGVPGNFASGSANSFGANYEHGAFGVGAAYTEVKYAGATASDPVVPVRNWGIGAHYSFSNAKLAVLFSTVKNRFNDAGAEAAEIGGSWLFTPALALGTSYMYMKGNAILAEAHAHQITSTLSYSLSKRTLLYLQGVYQRTNNGSHALINGVNDLNGSSSSSTQAIARVGLQTDF